MRRSIAGLLALVVVLGAGATPAHASKPTVEVTPHTGLSYNSEVMVSGDGWRPNSNVWVRQCSAGIWTGDENACGIRTLKRIKRHTHHFFMRDTIVVGVIGDGGCATTPQNFRSCAIEVVQLDENNQPTATVALRRIAFASD